MNYATISLFGTLISYYLPIEDNMIKMQIAMMLAGLLASITGYFPKITENILWYFRPRKNLVKINEKHNSEDNMIYNKVEDFIVDKYLEQLDSCELVPEKGEIIFMINNEQFKKKIEINHNDMLIEVEFIKNTENSEKEKNKKVPMGKSIVISSKKSNQDQLKKFVEEICQFKKPQSQILDIYKIDKTEMRDEYSLKWELIRSRCNKNFDNTIVTNNVKTELFDDIKWFYDNEEWYSNKGIPYKRGYVLYGPPGTGKTSIIKAIANSYNIPVFTIDFDCVRNNNDLIKLVTDINYFSQNNKYILCFEDIDRTSFIKSLGRYYDEKISLDCILNILDGIMETYGRIVIITANDISEIKKISALVRPGRIDKSILIDNCDESQVVRLFNNFFDENINENVVNIKSAISPAQFIKYMQQNMDKKEEILSNLDKLEPKLIMSNFEEESKMDFSLSSFKNKRNRHRGRGRRHLTLSYCKTSNEIKKLIKKEEKSYKKDLNRIKSYRKRKPKLEEKLTSIIDKEERKKIQEINKKNRERELRKCGHIKKDNTACKVIVPRKGMKCRYHRE